MLISRLRNLLVALGLAALAVPLVTQSAAGLTCLSPADCSSIENGLLPLEVGPFVGDDIEQLFVLDEILLVAARTDEDGLELWRTDLTEAGTAMLLDLNPGTGDGVVSRESAVLDGFLYFVGDDGVSGRELWRTDGTAAGTTLFKDILPGAPSGNPAHLSVSGSKLAWQASDGTGSSDLWITSGTAATTAKVIALGGGVTSDFDGIPVPAAGKFYFLGLSGGVRHLAVTDGTAAGTRLIKQFSTGIEWFTYPRSPNLDHRVLAEADRVYFSANDGSGSGRELWTSDGTTAGTTQVLDLTPGVENSILRPVAWWNGSFYFFNGGSASQFVVHKATGATAVALSWNTSNVLGVLGRGPDAFYVSRTIGQSSAEVVRANDAGPTSLEDETLPVQSIPGGVLAGDTFFSSSVVQAGGDRVQAFDGATGDLLAASGPDDLSFRGPVLVGNTLVIPTSENGSPWRLYFRTLALQVVNTVAPSVPGPVRVGVRLTVRPGTWTEGTAFSYQWTSNGAPIPGATGPSYTPVAADVGRRIAVTVTGTKANHQPRSVPSAAATVARGVLAVSKPRITGTARAGRTLRPVTVVGTPATRLTYRWLVAGRAVPGATRATYRVKAANRGKPVTVVVTATKPGYTTVTLRSAAKRVAR